MNRNGAEIRGKNPVTGDKQRKRTKQKEKPVTNGKQMKCRKHESTRTGMNRMT
jgi:hypothetical protein